MTAAEEGVLLLCSRLGDPDCKPLTMPQFRELGLFVRASKPAGDPLRDLTVSDLTALGYGEEQAIRVLRLLDRGPALRQYLSRGQRQDIHPMTFRSASYPSRIKQQLGHSCPPLFFYRGNPLLLEQPSIAVVGSRKLHPENEAFARQAGRLAAKAGLVLISGGATGADRAAQEACLEAGGSCVIVVADRLDQHPAHPRVLYLSADGYDLPFTNYRALNRNPWIHMLGNRTLAAQCTYGTGGTWQGCLDNLKHGWSDLFVFDDGSDGTIALKERGAIGITDLPSLDALKKEQLSLF